MGSNQDHLDDLDDELPALEENNGQEIQEEATVAVDSGGLVTATTQNAATAWIYDYVQVEGDAHPDGTIMLDPVDMRVMYGEYVNDMVDARVLSSSSFASLLLSSEFSNVRVREYK